MVMMILKMRNKRRNVASDNNDLVHHNITKQRKVENKGRIEEESTSLRFEVRDEFPDREEDEGEDGRNENEERRSRR